MIVRTRGGGQREFRAANNPLAQDYIPTPAEFGSWLPTATGERMTVAKAAGIPAVLMAIRLVSESTGSLPLRVYKGTGADKRPQEASWQWKLLHDRPNTEQSPFDFWHDVAACVETHGNAYLLKDKAGSVVQNLWIIDPSIVVVDRDRDTFAKVFKVRSFSGDGREARLTPSDVLHVRGLTLKGGDRGLSPLEIARESLGADIARYKHEGHFFGNHAEMPGVIEHPENLNNDQAKQFMRVWLSSHSGSANSGLPGLLSSGAKWKQLGLTMKDAEFIASHNFAVRDIGRMFSIPADLLNADESETNVEQITKRFLSLGLGTRLSRLESAIRTDPDLFGGSDLYPQFYTRDFIRLDASTEAEVRHKDVQSGVLLVDEARADQGRPPLPNGIGQIPQIVPVGGSPAGVPMNGANGTNGNGSVPAGSE